MLTGQPATEVAALAGREHADLIVLATHGLSGYRKMLLGSTTEKVLRHTTVRVLVAPPPEQAPAAVDRAMGMGRVLAPVDFKRECLEDPQVAVEIARTFGARLQLVHVVAPVRGLERLRPALDTHNRLQIERAEQQMGQLVSELG